MIHMWLEACARSPDHRPASQILGAANHVLRKPIIPDEEVSPLNHPTKGVPLSCSSQEGRGNRADLDQLCGGGSLVVGST
jgi:hypothetical protein